MEKRELNVEMRTNLGKGASRRLRVKKKIPIIFYGRHLKTPVPMAIETSAWAKISGTGSSVLFTFKSRTEGAVDGKIALVRETQHHPVSDECIHVDFIEVRMDEKIKVHVPVLLMGKAKGVVEGGILQQIRREIEVRSLPGNIPDKIEADVTNLDIGESLHINEVVLPSGITVVEEVNYTLAAVVPPEELAKTIEQAEVATTEGGEAQVAVHGEGEAEKEGAEVPAEKTAGKKGEAAKSKEK